MTTLASKLKPGSAIKWNGALYKVLETEFRGTGKSAKMVQTRLRDIAKNINVDHRFDGDEKVDEVELDRTDYQFLYNDGNTYHFMEPASFEQIQIDVEAIGKAAPYLKPETMIQVEFYEGKPVSIQLPEFIEIKVISAPPALKESGSSKEVTLENGIKILVPQFISEGESIRVDWAHTKYVDRVKENK